MKPARKRQLVDELRSVSKVSTRRACSTLQVDRALYLYKSRRGEQAYLKASIKEIARDADALWLPAHSCAAAA